MKSITFAISKGGVGKSLLTANVGAALAKRGKKVVLVEGDPNRPLQSILRAELGEKAIKLDDIVKRNLRVDDAVYSTNFENLFLIPTGVPLESYLEINPVLFAKKLLEVDADFMFVDTPFPLGKAAFLSLGVCEYFIMILTEDEFNLCVEAALDTNRLGKYLFKCIPLGFVLNRIKNPEKFTDELISDLEDLFGVPCMAKIMEDLRVQKSYGGIESQKAFLAYEEFEKSGFKESIDKIASRLMRKLPKSEKTDPPGFLKGLIESIKIPY